MGSLQILLLSYEQNKLARVEHSQHIKCEMLNNEMVDDLQENAIYLLDNKIYWQRNMLSGKSVLPYECDILHQWTGIINILQFACN